MVLRACIKLLALVVSAEICGKSIAFMDLFELEDNSYLPGAILSIVEVLTLRNYNV